MPINNTIQNNGLVKPPDYNSMPFQNPSMGGTTTPSTYSPVLAGIKSVPQIGGGNTTTTQNTPSQLSLASSGSQNNYASSPQTKTPDYSNYANYMSSQGFSNNTNPEYDTSRNNPIQPQPQGVFPGLIKNLSNQSSQPTQGFNQFQNTAQTAANNLLTSAPQQNADVLAQKQAIQDLTMDYNRQKANIMGSRTNLQEAGGEQGLLGNLYASNLGALNTGLSNILQGNAQQQAAFTGAGNLSNTGAGVATGQQATQQSGLGAAAGLTQPQQVSPTNVPYNPAEGTYGNPASTAYGQNGLQGVGNIQGQIGIGQDVAQQNAFLGSAQATGSALQNLITENNINPSAFTPLNGALQAGAQYTSNPAYQKFSGQISDFVSKIAPILGGPGGATTDYRTHLAGSILNAWASGESINDVISYFLNQARQNIQQYSQGGGVGYGQNNATGNPPYRF